MSTVVNEKEIIDRSSYKNDLIYIISYTDKYITKEKLSFNDMQRVVLINHLNEMIGRIKRGEKITEVDSLLFSDVSDRAIDIAKKVAKECGTEDVNEVFVLSIHFEAVLLNEG